MTDISGVFTKAAFRKDHGLYGAGPAIAYPETPGAAALAATHLVPFSEDSMSKAIEHLKANVLIGSGQVLPQGLIGLTAAGGIGGPLTYTGWERLVMLAMGYCNPEDSPAFVGTTISAVNISDATNADPIVIESATHSYTTGDGVKIASVGGNTNANGEWRVTVVDATHFSLDNSEGNAAYTAGGTATKYEAFAHLFELDEALQDQAWDAAELDGYALPSANDRKVRRGMLGFKKATDYVTSSCMVNKMTITGTPSEVKVSFELIGYDVVTGAYNSANWTAPTGSPALALFQQAVVNVAARAGGVPATEYGINGWELTVNNNLKADDQSTESAPNILIPIRNGPREVTLKLDFPRYNSTIDVLHAFADANTELAASIVLTGPVIAGAYTYSWGFYMSSLRAITSSTSIGGGGVIPSSIEFEAARPGGSDVFDGATYNSITLMKDSELVVQINNNIATNYILEN